jgi:hypothetical protein
LRDRAIAVSNSAATEGGQRIETRFVSADDYVDAVAELRTALDRQLAERLADPDALQPGLRVFPATARRGAPAPSPEREAVVGDQATEFRLTLKETAAVTAVDEARLQALAAARLRAALPRDRRLLDGSLRTTHQVLATTGGRVQYRVEASGEHWHPVDARALLSQVKGKSIAGARQTLERYGEVQIDRWPDYVDTIPSFGDRASLVVAEPQPGAP